VLRLQVAYGGDEDSCAPHRPGGGFWSAELQPSVRVVDGVDTDRGDAALFALLLSSTDRAALAAADPAGGDISNSWHMLGAWLNHARAAEDAQRRGLPWALVLEADVVALQTHVAAPVVAAALRSLPPSAPWLLKLAASFRAPLRTFAATNATCTAECRCAVQDPSARLGWLRRCRLRDARGCDVRSSVAYAISGAGYGRFTALLQLLRATATAAAASPDSGAAADERQRAWLRQRIVTPGSEHAYLAEPAPPVPNVDRWLASELPVHLLATDAGVMPAEQSGKLSGPRVARGPEFAQRCTA